MFTRCPNCGTVFNISEQQLAIANGSVRCGACEIIFDSRLSLFAKIDYPPEPDADVDATAEADIIMPAGVTTDDNEKQETLLDPVNTPTQSSIPEEISDQISELESDANSSNFTKFFSTIVFLVLCALFALQIIALYKPYLLPSALQTNACKWIKCTTTTPTALDKIEILNRDIISHPEAENSLLVTMTMISRAEFSQPYPMIELRLFDVVGDIIAARRFAPHEYLPIEGIAKDKFPPITPVSIQINLVDPGEKVVGYELNFM